MSGPSPPSAPSRGGNASGPFYPLVRSPGPSTAGRFTTTMTFSETPQPITPVSPRRLANHNRSYYVRLTDGSSPGKVCHFLDSSASYTGRGYVRDFGLRSLRRPRPPRQPPRGSHRVRTADLNTPSFRSFIGPGRPVIPVYGQLSRGFFRHPWLLLHIPSRQRLWLDFHQLVTHHAGRTAPRRPCDWHGPSHGNGTRNRTAWRSPPSPGPSPPAHPCPSAAPGWCCL